MQKKELIEALNWRYAVKRFDPAKRIDEATWSALEQSLVLTPSSYGLQPWKFIIITDPQVKDKLPEISWNQNQPRDCSHMVILAALRQMDEAHIARHMRHVVETREMPANAMDGYRDSLVKTVGGMEKQLDWNAHQVYIALGQLMLAAAVLQIDTCPLEGILTKQYDELLGLSDSPYTSVVGCALGYRHAEDPQADLKKVRFPAEDLVVRM
ncbi:MAG: NAD(P)H-dependent oxidoreductase [Planctomycetota bacterium]|nr:NAD(P)H-dependent oxidoreductase [Planctomycetota bacterium]